MNALPSSSPAREGTRERLIEAAKELFSEHGYAATGTRAIAARAGCNISLIKHYFGSKQGLLAAVAGTSMTEMGERMRATLEGAGSAEERLDLFVDTLVDHFDRNREGIRIFHREVIQSDADVGMVRPFIERNSQMLAAVLRELHAKDAGGEPGGRPDIDPRVAGMLLMAMLQFYFIAYPLTSQVVGERTPEVIASLKRHIKRIFLRGMKG